MKSLFRLLVVVILLLGAGAFFLRDSPWWTVLEIQRGLDDKDVARVERVVALERFAASSTAVLGAVVSDRLGLSGTDPQSQMLATAIGVVAGGVADFTAKQSAAELRRAIADGRLERRIGPFVLNDGLAALGAMTTTVDGATLELQGSCDGKPATLLLILERYEDGLLGGRPRRFVVAGVEPESARALARQCAVAGGDAVPAARKKR